MEATDHASETERLSDEELISLALAADPHAPLDPDAVPWSSLFSIPGNLLPEWYMPHPVASRRGRGTQIVVLSIVAGMLLIGAFGLCITSGFLSLA
jgi:hypothetical protein